MQQDEALSDVRAHIQNILGCAILIWCQVQELLDLEEVE
jgi:hypothetical protein